MIMELVKKSFVDIVEKGIKLSLSHPVYFSLIIIGITKVWARPLDHDEL
jgi:hypothetical protein